ncbi:hypothetical protein QFC21_002534 [Naganishia friedmannii]|uniref:Uncharacterized protein n=1 Tax=Naganishia friedmannii TaxID=89922 RepID=A0ACC2VXG2_9TREE|nr:hypothetical protein QFC21_002534 [Naganishia friedmannii]
MPARGIAALCVSVVPVVLLAVVTFNTPYLKSLNFLQAKYSGFEATFGTLGYCTTGGTAVTGTTNGTVNGCVGPKIGYQFDPDTIFGLSNSLFDIPTVVTKYLTYVLFLHAIAFIFNVLDMIPGFSVACFPSLCAWLTSFFTLISFIIDLVMFYIAKARIDKVSGASATIGICVWLTLAAWVVTGVLGCLIGVTSCCASRVKKDQEESRRNASYKPMKQDTPAHDDGNYPDHLTERSSAHSPHRRETEVAPQIAKYDHGDDEYKMDHYGSTPGALPYGHGGAHQQPIDGVGYGYGQRTSQEYLLNPAGGQPRLVTPPIGDRGYVPSSTAYADPYAAQSQELLASQMHGQNPYGNTPFPAGAAAGSSNNLVPGHPPQGNGLNRAMTPASTYAGSFVGVGSGRHEGMPMPVGMAEHVLPVGGAAYAGARQMRQASGSGPVYADAQYGQQQQATQQYPYPQQQQQQQNPYAANTTLMRPPSSEEQRRQTMYAPEPHAQGQSTQDAYGGYEEPPMGGYPSQPQTQQPYPDSNSNYRNTMHTVAPQPQRLHTQGVNAPSFPLDQVTSPTGMTSHSHSHSYTSPTGYGHAQLPMQMPEVERARDMGPVNDAPPPMYNEHSGGGHNYPPQQTQQPYGGNSKSGYFN